MSSKTEFNVDFWVDDKRAEIKPIDGSSGVNVVYFTNKCNLNCTYCYEDLPGRPPQILSREKLREIVDATLAREDDDKQTLFVLFGGEATLEWDNVNYLMEYAYERKKFIHFNLETNGIKFLSDNFLETVKNNYFYKHGHMSIDISFDGVGNKERVFHNGQESTSSMLKIFKKLNDHHMRYRIRYTIHNLNIDYVYEDITRLIKTFKPERVITSIAWSTLNNDQIESLSEIKELLRKDWINNSIATPVCEVFCDMCKGCDVTKEIKTYFSDEGNVHTLGIFDNAPNFDDFKQKETL